MKILEWLADQWQALGDYWNLSMPGPKRPPLLLWILAANALLAAFLMPTYVYWVLGIYLGILFLASATT